MNCRGRPITPVSDIEHAKTAEEYKRLPFFAIARKVRKDKLEFGLLTRKASQANKLAGSKVLHFLSHSKEKKTKKKNTQK